MMDFEFYAPTKIVFGCGTLHRAGEVFARLTPAKALVVTGRSSMKSIGALDKVLDGLRYAGAESVVYDKVTPDPKSSEVDAGAELAREKRVDLIIGLGGGSAIDAAKAIAVGASKNKPIEEFIDGERIEDDITPLVAIPSTAGTGSEVSRAAIITRGDGSKGGVRGNALFPQLALVDPELTLSVPPDTTFDTGFDALAHAIESYVTKNANPITDALAEKAMKLIKENLPHAIEDGSNITARTNLSLASTLMGVNIATAGTCTAHKMQYPLAAVAHASHGRMLAAIIPAWVGWMQEVGDDKFSKIAETFGGDNAADALRGFTASMGYETRLRDFGVKEGVLQEVSEEVDMKVGCDPRDVSKKDVLKIFEKAF